jgi:hypothetical protein
MFRGIGAKDKDCVAPRREGTCVAATFDVSASPSNERMRLARREVFFFPSPSSNRAPASGRRPKTAWRPGPMFVGALLSLACPFGLALLWKSERCRAYGREARVALTVVGVTAFVLEIAVLWALGR